MTITIETNVFTYYTVRTTCVDDDGETVDRYLGFHYNELKAHVQAWVDASLDAYIHFPSWEDAKNAVTKPYSYSGKNSHYTGNTILIEEVTQKITTETTNHLCLPLHEVKE